MRLVFEFHVLKLFFTIHLHMYACDATFMSISENVCFCLFLAVCTNKQLERPFGFLSQVTYTKPGGNGNFSLKNPDVK